MKPGILFVCDPSPKSAQREVRAMLELLGGVQPTGTICDSGANWAAAAVPPPASEPTCGADILVEGQDVLMWSGELFLPDHWPNHPATAASAAIAGSGFKYGQRTLSRALLSALRNHGIESLSEVDGAFCGAWYDGIHHRWVIFNDKLSLIPVFWSANGDRLVVSPRATITWQASRLPLQISDQGVADLLRTQNMTDDHTLIEGVHWLKRAHALLCGDEGAGSYRYWSLEPSPEPITDIDEALDGYIEAMTQALRRHSACSAPLLLGLSGGLDSRLILAICKSIGRVPDCFTAGWPFYEDVRYGRQLARVAGAHHEIAEMDAASLPDRLERAVWETDGLQSAAHLGPAATACDYLQKHRGAVLLEGFFHGWVGGGTVPADEEIAHWSPAHRTAWARRMFHAGGDFDFVNNLLLPDIARDSYRRWQLRVDEADRESPVQDLLRRAECVVMHSRRGRIDVLGTGLLRNHVLVRNPAADSGMIQWHLKVSPQLRRRRGIFVEALCRRFPAFAAVPRADNSGGLPILQGRWRREYHWQRAKLYRWYIGLRQPWTRRWGIGNQAIRAWAFDTWRRSGRLEMLLEHEARVLNWVRPQRLRQLWSECLADPLKSEPLLTLAGLEYIVRRLEGLRQDHRDVFDMATLRSATTSRRVAPPREAVVA